MLFLTRLAHHCQSRPHHIALEFLQEFDSSRATATGDEERGDTPRSPRPAALFFQEPQPPAPVSYAHLETTVRRTMAYLQSLGVQPGDRVALQLPKCLPFIYLHLAVMRLGAISLPLNPAYPPRELTYFLSDSEASLFFTAAEAEPRLKPVLAALPALRHTIYLRCDAAGHFNSLLAAGEPNSPDLPPLPSDPEQTALMIYTSGTTGRPKGAQLSHRNLTATLDALHTAWGWQADDLLLHVLPIFHVHGLIVALQGALHAGAAALLLPKFDPLLTLETLVGRRCTVFMGVPTIHHRLLAVPSAAAFDLSHMRLLTSGSDRLPDETFYGFQQTFGHTLLERYGMTETGMNLSNPLHGERRVGSVGLPLPGVELRIVNPDTAEPLPDGQVGELQLRGPNVFSGYWRQPDKSAAAFTADGWLRTGDLGLRAPDGYVTLKGRHKDLIISGGLNVYPPEVELVLTGHPAVAAGAVIGCPDPDWGERVTALIVIEAGHTATEAELVAFCREHLAPYKVPRTIVFVDSLPRNALGKVQKAELRREFCV
jgi:malonyl-CoA/methylmalonyl-CoA synthetase